MIQVFSHPRLPRRQAPASLRPEPGGHSLALPDPMARWATLGYPLLFRGERGTGKTEFASRIHAASGRPGRFVDASMAHISRGLEVAELLGHCRGAFTTAIADREGLFARAHRGTLLLDELGRASLEAQGAMLGFLDHGRVTPVGGSRELVLETRVIAATNADLEALVSAGTFLADLLDRFGYYVITLAPLRECRGEILPLGARFLDRECAAIGRSDAPRLSPAVQRVMLKAPWPGNVRDLLKVAQYLAGNAGELAELGDLPAGFLATIGLAGGSQVEPLAVRARRAVEDCGGNKSEAARQLGVSRGHLHRVLKVAV